MGRWFRGIDIALVSSLVLLLTAGLITMRSFGGSSNYFFTRQLIWIVLGFFVFLLFRQIDWRIFKLGFFVIILYTVGVVLLVALFVYSSPVRGSSSWFIIGPFSFEPSELIKILLLLLFAKYFSRRHVQIAQFRHIFISALYLAVPLFLVAAQPDLGTTAILFFLWLSMMFASGIRIKHVVVLGVVALILVYAGWSLFLAPYQKARLVSFFNPWSDAQGTGYQAVQSMTALGSAGLFGKGIGMGNQSRLNFLPEHETDFIFAAFAEEWGLLGVVFLLTFFGIMLWRILKIGLVSTSNFVRLYSIGFAVMLFVQAFIHISMNIGILPITGLGLPFVSYGGSALISYFAGLGILSNVRNEGILGYSTQETS